MVVAEENTGNGEVLGDGVLARPQLHPLLACLCRLNHPANFGSGHWQRAARGAQLRLTLAVAAAASPSSTMIISKKNRHKICKYLFHEGVLYAKDYNLAKHPKLDVPNLEVIKLIQSFKSKEYVRETFSWQYYYWYLTNDGIEHLCSFLNLPSEIVPNTLKKSSRPPSRPFGSGPPGDRPRS